MKIVESIKETRQAIGQIHRDGETVCLVPTMGNLHQGHLALVAQAKELADRVIVSIFVNPRQFGENEDFSTYPRTFEQDAALLESMGVDLLFYPQVAEIYPDGSEQITRIHVPTISEVLCGESRPGHFDGMVSVVNTLFNIVQPDSAIFGEKDFQQLAIIKMMVRQLHLAVKVYGHPIVREASGLAMSSRNQYLTDDERCIAPTLYQTLQAAAEQIAEGKELAFVESGANARLAKAGFITDYLKILNPVNLCEPEHSQKHLVILAAAHLGNARLIDNLEINSPYGLD